MQQRVEAEALHYIFAWFKPCHHALINLGNVFIVRLRYFDGIGASISKCGTVACYPCMDSTHKLFCSEQNHTQGATTLSYIQNLTDNRGVLRGLRRSVLIQLVYEDNDSRRGLTSIFKTSVFSPNW